MNRLSRYLGLSFAIGGSLLMLLGQVRAMQAWGLGMLVVGAALWALARRASASAS